jgi:hypothetical protein
MHEPKFMLAVTCGISADDRIRAEIAAILELN